MQKTILLTFDDAVISQFVNVAPLLKEFGFGATFFACRFNDDWREKHEAFLMTGKQLKKLEELGFEIGNHTWNHPDLRNCSAKEIQMEIDRMNSFFAEHGIKHPVSFAYPGGPYAENAVGILKQKGFSFARSVRKEAFLPQTCDPMNLPSIAIQGKDPDLFYNAVSMATNDSPVILVFHGVPEYVHPWVDQDFSLFKEFMMYLKKNSFRVLGLKDFFEGISQKS